MRSLRSPRPQREQPLLAAAREKPTQHEDPAQPQINKLIEKQTNKKKNMTEIWPPEMTQEFTHLFQDKHVSGVSDKPLFSGHWYSN